MNRAAALRANNGTFAEIERTRLVATILSAPDHLHHLLLTPPGYGKSTLLRQIAAQLDTDRASIACLTPREVALFEAREPMTLIIDRADACDPVALTRLASSTRLIMAARQRPRIETAALELEERLKVWGVDALKCDALEAATLLRAMGALFVSNALVADIMRRAEGWFAGVKLLAMQRQEEGRTDDRAPQRVGPRLAAYFDETILAALTPDQRRKLTLASITDEICPSLFEGISGGGDLHDIVARGALLFETPRGDWLRFHPLFRQHLAAAAARLPRRERSAAHRAAAEWRLAAGTPTDAAAHALECGDMDFAADVINEGARGFIANGQISEALAWLDQAPTLDSCARPWTRLFHVTALTAANRLAEAERCNTDVEQKLEHWSVDADARAAIATHIRFHRELIEFCGNPEKQDLRRVDKLLTDTAGRHPVVHGESMLIKGGVLFRQGQFAQARCVLGDASPHLQSTGSWYALAIAQVMLAQMDISAGAMRNAEERASTLIETITHHASARAPVIAPLLLLLGDIAFSRNALDGAENYLAEADAVLPSLRGLEWDFEAYMLRASIAAARGETDAAICAAQAARAIALQLSIASLGARASAFLALRFATRGQLDEARAQLPDARRHGASPHALPNQTNLARLHMRIADLQLRLYDGKVNRSPGDVVAFARRIGDAPLLLKALFTQAALLHTEDEEARAFRVLREALRLCRNTNALRALLDFEAPAFKAVLSAYARTPEGAADEALKWARQSGPNTPHETRGASAISGPGAHNLTGKELQVLNLIDAGRSNQDIASELMISLATAKWHVRNILSKLDAANRVGALARARQLGVIV